MKKGTFIVLCVWVVLALLSLTSAIFTPIIFWKIVNYVFGVLNLVIIGGLGVLIHDEHKNKNVQLQIKHEE